MSTAFDDLGTALERGGKNNGTAGSNATGNVLTNDTGLGKMRATEVRLGDSEGRGTAGAIGSALVGEYGSLNLKAGGNYTYKVDERNPDVQALGAGESLTESFNYTMSSRDGTDIGVLTITVMGANDAPVATNDSATASKDGAPATGNILGNDTDVDNDSTDFSVTALRLGSKEGTGTTAVLDPSLGSYTLQGTYGTLTGMPDGSYSYEADPTNTRVARLSPTQMLTDNFNYTMSDGSLTDTGRIIIRITGAAENTPPVAGDDTGTATEKGGVDNGAGGNDATGKVLGNDSDAETPRAGLSVIEVRTGTVEGAGTLGTVGIALLGQYGSLILNGNGSYRYIVDNTNLDVEALGVGQSLTDSFNYMMTDGSLTDRAVLTITVEGASDAPTGIDDAISVPSSGVARDGNVLTNDVDDPGVLSVTQIRNGAVEGSGTAGTIGGPLAGLYGTLTMNADGTFIYAADPSNPTVENLLPGQQLTESFNYQLSDGAYTDHAVLTATIVGSGVIIDGSLSDWNPDHRLDGGEVAGYALYGTSQHGNFVFGIDAGTVLVGPGTTIWLDTDLNAATGFMIFGFAGGAEAHIEFEADGVARLYSDDGQALGPISYAVSDDGHTAEFSVSKAILGGMSAVNAFVDVNDAVFLPTAYANGGYRVGSLAPATVGSITVDGLMSDWGAPLNTPADSPPGFAIHGDVQEQTFLFALTNPLGEIGPHTTIWLDTDRDASTGYQIFGFAGGAEYNIEIGTDHTARLYTGAPGQTFVAELAYNYSADQRSIEIALPANLMNGSPIGATVYADINDATFLPGSYATQSYSVGKLSPPLPVDPSDRIAIVYSDTTADNYFSRTAYGQLFMSAQNQAMQAGIPFDLLTEADLKDASKLVGYDAIVFPGMQNVKAADLTAITNALTIASKEYGVGLITQGNFLTNDENDAALPRDSYARMKSLLGVTLEASGATSGITLTAGSAAHPILSGFTPGEVVGTYANISYQSFQDVSGRGQILFEQSAAGTTRAAVIATTTGGNNVVFSSDAISGNNNILSHAIDWAVQTTPVDVGIAITRFDAIFASRTDMDQSQETYDVIDQNPGIYDEMLPIIAEWKQTYDFVGSFYINVGANAPDQETDWAISGPYYQQLLALGNQIGTHSYTHPHDTNVLVPTSEASPALLALLAAIDPDNPNAVDPSTLSDADLALLSTSFQFQFEYSKKIIEQQLGITVTGAALPGNPESVDTAHEILPYFDYITGGWSGVGGGFPGAFGFMTPADMEHVYLAPNMVFDFTLIGFQGLTPEQAQAEWLREFAELTAHGTAPIIHFPWHDYGVTNWDLGDPVKLDYTLEMFTSVLDAAVQSGAEFVADEDLASRIHGFQASNLTVSQAGNVVTASLTSPDAGKFALTFGDDATQIASASLDGSGWYAWDGNRLFTPKDGGTFEVTLGTPADVTHVSALPMRADLISVTGEGTDLAFSFIGEGTAEVSLKTQGTNAVVATGADSGSAADGVLSLVFDDAGPNSASIAYSAGGFVVGTAVNEVILGGSDADTIRAAGGSDDVYGGTGADIFEFALGSDTDAIHDFTPGVDWILLDGLGFATAQEALDAFVPDADGLVLFAGADILRLIGLELGELSASDILLDSAIA